MLSDVARPAPFATDPIADRAREFCCAAAGYPDTTAKIADATGNFVSGAPARVRAAYDRTPAMGIAIVIAVSALPPQSSPVSSDGATRGMVLGNLGRPLQ